MGLSNIGPFQKIPKCWSKKYWSDYKGCEILVQSKSVSKYRWTPNLEESALRNILDRKSYNISIKCPSSLWWTSQCTYSITIKKISSLMVFLEDHIRTNRDSDRNVWLFSLCSVANKTLMVRENKVGQCYRYWERAIFTTAKNF